MKGCMKFGCAIVAGLVLGLGGLSVALWLWAGVNVFSPKPAVVPPEWGAFREAALSVKLAGAFVAIKRGQEKDFEISLRPDELNHLLAQRLPQMFKKTDLAVDAGDTATIIRFSRQIKPGRYINGEVHANITGHDGQFEVKVLLVKTGRKDLPHSLFYPVSRWMENTLETQLPFKDLPYKLTGFHQDGKNLVVNIHTRGKTGP